MAANREENRVSVLFVCLGNICRSPTAEGLFRACVQRAGLEDRIEIDSCGTGGWHVGKSPDERATAAAARRGIDLTPLRARQFSAGDLDRFDFILTMDRQNLADIKDFWRQNGGTEPALFLDYAPEASVREVPDPYYGGDQGFEYVLDLIEAASDGLLETIREQLR